MKSLFQKLGALLATLRVWTINLVTLLILLYVVVAVISVIGRMPAAVDPEGKVLILNPDGLILDQEVFPSDFSFPFTLPEENQLQSRDLIRLIRAAAEDERLAGVMIDFSEASFAGPSTVLNIANELAALRQSGKPVIAFSESMTTASYLMAAQADEIYVHQSGAVSVTGIGGYRRYTRELTDKLKITIHNYSQGDFKSALEGLTRNDMSAPDRLQREELYGPIWTALKNGMAEARGLEPELFQNMADNYSAPLLDEAAYDGLAFAEEQGVIDGTMSFPEFRSYMIEKFGKAEDEERDTYPHIGADAYFAQLEADDAEAEDAVAVVFVEGGIQPGEIGPGVAGADDVARLIRRAHEDESTKALVLRVNSPGGSIIASDIIRDELLAAGRKDLPVYVSMGDVAASGGVWVSTPADVIYAEPTTITGSIGVAIAFPTLERSLEYVGLHYDGVTTSEHAGWGINMPVNEKLDALFARFGSSAYQRFIDHVAVSRDKEPEYIRSIAGGRVWLAPRAQEIGLIDEIGTMEQTLEAAAAAAGLEDYRVNYVVKEPSFGMALLQRFSASAGIELKAPFEELVRGVASLAEILENLDQPTATVMCTDCLVELR
ncbi:MAG: signal peptide peptidase SppA [Halieaceae bacterium]